MSQYSRTALPRPKPRCVSISSLEVATDVASGSKRAFLRPCEARDLHRRRTQQQRRVRRRPRMFGLVRDGHALGAEEGQRGPTRHEPRRTKWQAATILGTAQRTVRRAVGLFTIHFELGDKTLDTLRHLANETVIRFELESGRRRHERNPRWRPLSDRQCGCRISV